MSLVHVPKSGLLRQDLALARLGRGVASAAGGSFLRHPGPRRKSRNSLVDDWLLHASKRPLVGALIYDGSRCTAALLGDRLFLTREIQTQPQFAAGTNAQSPFWLTKSRSQPLVQARDVCFVCVIRGFQNGMPEAQHERREQFGALLRQAGERYGRDGIRTIIVVDGLDHVPREERPTNSLLGELPLPAAIPTGVTFVLGTQRLDLTHLKPAVKEQAEKSERLVQMRPLGREAVARRREHACRSI